MKHDPNGHVPGGALRLRALRMLHQVLAPRQGCELCGARAGTEALCRPCRADLPRVPAPCCPVCALPRRSATRCESCRPGARPFDATIAALDYRFPVDVIVQALKYRGELALAAPLGNMLVDALADAARPDLLLPTPPSPGRLRRRGFHHAGEIARVVGQRLGIASVPTAARRVRDGEPQAGLALAMRHVNLHRAFECHRADLVRGRHVALIDDVMTSGATLTDLARAVRAAGAARVVLWVVARAVPDGGAQG